MDILISFYDNLLIYYTNLFFAVFFLLFYLFFIVYLYLIPYLKLFRHIRKVKGYRYHVKSPKVNIKNYLIFFAQNVISTVYQWIEFVEIQTEKILKRIAREILLDEKN